MPIIMCDKYYAPLLGFNDYQVKGFSTKDSNSLYLPHVDLTIKYNLVIGESDGCIILEDEDTCVGNINFTIAKSKIANYSNCISINSTVVEYDYRGLSIAPLSYDVLTQHYNLVSDYEQTQGGASIWRTKLTQNPYLDIFIIDEDDQLMKDREGNAIPYKFDITGTNPLDNKIWGFENPELQKENSPILASEVQDNENIRLIALRNTNKK